MRKKLVLLGEMAVGKTSIVRRLVHDRFEGNYKGTLGHDIYAYTLPGLGPQQDQSLELVIWDTDGGLGMSAFHIDAAVKGASAVIIVADVTRPRTLATMSSLSRECDSHLPGRPAFLVFNKVDVLGPTAEFTVPTDLAASGNDFLKTSAKSGENIKEAFIHVANAILRRGL